MAKITQLQVWIIGVILSIIAGVVVYFALIKPNNELKDAADQKYTAAEAIAVTMPEKQTDRKKAVAEVAEAERDWAIYDRTLMPDINVSNLLTGIQQLWTEQVQVLGPKVQKYLRADKTVQIVSANLQLPAPSTDPNAVAKKAFQYDMGTVSVAGTFQKVLDHAERWNKFDRLVLMDGLTLAGNSPRLVGTYTLRCFIFTHGADKPGPTIPQAGGGAAGGFPGGGFPGGADGGFPGVPPGGFPSGDSGIGGPGDLPGGGPAPVGLQNGSQ